MDSIFAGTYLYKLFTWQHPPLTQYATIIFAHIFFYLYILREWSLLSMLSLYIIARILFSLIRPPTPIDKSGEWLTEESAKQLYTGLYIALNKFVQYMRNIIQVKGGMKAVAKAAAFMYASLLVKAVGDKVLVYLVFVGLLVKSKMPERPEKKEGEAETKNILLEQVWPLIPKYSDLQKKKE
ncbi:hypothetical protein FGO68_gene2220 [Halteria grandinella]|uniref:Uncharacterized protein n=1 Tax=Halteria grandinella TaxID=5974 RepID=A0A8J8SWB9_HALGN|nr:hypothetical protein FGO68_gene2220 [Halteria grandinella]